MKLRKNFFKKHSLETAKNLIGKELVHITSYGTISGKIVETEAYGGAEDKASHGFSGKKTKRNSIMFLPGGFIYIYLIYGMYYCFNIVTGNKEEPEAVLIRAIEPVKGIKLMKKNRNFNNLNRTNTVNLSNGPGKLCQAMGFTLKENGIDICKSRKIFIKDSPFISEKLIEYTTRKNIDYAGKAKDFPWRVILKNSKYVSK